MYRSIFNSPENTQVGNVGERSTAETTICGGNAVRNYGHHL